ncbi:winged helix-turn-helix domain-containing protein [Lysobacter sp. A3-1-A15]|uniref:winged helix-turn-helix domain-containing protein n=1 Tax=Novilysobacter viscosus TaxID=3098602 RepID=UPI002EDB8149
MSASDDIPPPLATPTRVRFEGFVLDTANRSLGRDGVPVALNARYFDALVLLVREHGQLVGKQRFFDEVWAGSVVTDAALTQCIKEIRRLLGDDAGRPRFVRTVAGHGYVFIAQVHDDTESVGVPTDAPAPVEAGSSVGKPPTDSDEPLQPALARVMRDGAAATAGGAAAGLLGGLLYGSALAVAPQSQGLGTLSILMVLLALSLAVGMAGAMGVGVGMAAGRLRGSAAGMLAGGAVGGLVVGGLVRLLGSDTFTLLVGRAPTGITGGLEGAVIGFALAVGVFLGGGLEQPRGWRPAWSAALSTGIAGALVTLAGGSLMATSLMRVAATFDETRLDMAPLGALLGEPQLGMAAQAALGLLEGGIFGGCVAAAMLLARGQGASGMQDPQGVRRHPR